MRLSSKVLGSQLRVSLLPTVLDLLDEDGFSLTPPGRLEDIFGKARRLAVSHRGQRR